MHITALTTSTLDHMTLPFLIKSKGDGNQHVVIFVHGLFSNHESEKFINLSTLLCRHDMDSLLFSYRAHGNNHNTPLTINGAMLDFMAIYEWASRHYKHISIVSTSFGSSLVLNSLQSSPLSVDRLIFLNPLIDYEAIPIESIDIADIMTKGHGKFRNIQFTHDFYTEFRSLKPYLAKLEAYNVLIIQSRFDDRCPLDVLLNYYGNLQAHIKIVDSDHSFTHSVDQVNRLVLDYMLNRTC